MSQTLNLDLPCLRNFFIKFAQVKQFFKVFNVCTIHIDKPCVNTLSCMHTEMKVAFQKVLNALGFVIL